MDLLPFTLMLSASSICYYPEGLTGGGGRKDCTVHHSANHVTWSTSICFIVMASTVTFWIRRENKLLKLRESMFEQNGGNLLMKKLSKLKGPAKKQIRLYTADDMRKATNNYSSEVICKWEWTGTFHHGRIAESNEDAGMDAIIMNIPAMSNSQIEQFVDQLIFLSQPHRNLVRVIGCCLETSSPLLVYELHDHWMTLFDHVNDKSLVSHFSCEQRVKAAVGAARALAYLHGGNSRSIVHSNVNSANIFLDDSKEARLLYVVAPSVIPQCMHSTNQNRFFSPGQLNKFGKGLSELLTGWKPTAFNRNKNSRDGDGSNQQVKQDKYNLGQLNQKSDVYSFGKVLSELLTGWKPIALDRKKNNRNGDGDNQQVKEKIAKLAEECLCEESKKRPNMKQVEEKLSALMDMR